jgi:replicative DNA helicase
MKLSDSAAERAVLSGIFNYGEDVYFDICDLVQEQSFTIDSNVYLYKCFRHIFTNNQNPKLDVALVLSAAEELSLSKILTTKEEIQHLQAIINFPVDKGNLRKFASKIKKLEIARLLQQQLEEAKDKVLKISGNESIGNIVGIAEDIIFNFTSMLNDTEDAPTELGKNIEDYIKDIIENPIDQIGIPTGFPVYDKSIGGGLRKSTVNVIAARPKTGKTLLADNMSYNIAAHCDVPVLNLDTEMTREDHINRTLAMMTDVEINEIETGKFSQSPTKTDKITKSVGKLKNLKIFHKSIAGKPFEDQLSLVRRWLIKDVGLNEDGTAKDCVIFYDYLKLMDSQGMSQDMKEYQVLGFMMTQLHNFATKYKVPVVAFVQLNRDGITKETTDTASGSDRIIWLCSNFTIFKRKTDEEIAEDGPAAGNRKLLPVISRHGGGLDDNDYINCHMEGQFAKIKEGKTRLELMKSDDSSNDIQEYIGDNQEEIPFG